MSEEYPSESREITFQTNGSFRDFSKEEIAELKRLLKKAGFSKVTMFTEALTYSEPSSVFELSGPGADCCEVDGDQQEEAE